MMNIWYNIVYNIIYNVIYTHISTIYTGRLPNQKTSATKPKPKPLRSSGAGIR